MPGLTERFRKPSLAPFPRGKMCQELPLWVESGNRVRNCGCPHHLPNPGIAFYQVTFRSSSERSSGNDITALYDGRIFVTPFFLSSKPGKGSLIT